jgi:GNAT superfamily N-acetyltransferase
MINNVCIRPARPSDVKAIARIHVDGWRCAYADFIPAYFLTQLSYEEDSASFREWLFRTTPAPATQVAVIDSQLVGFCVAGPNSDEETRPYDSEIHKLFVRPEYQNQGIGRQLLHATALDLLQRGFHSVVLWAYSAGQSIGFYQHLCGEVVYQTSQKAGDKELEVQVFGWAIKDLLSRTTP